MKYFCCDERRRDLIRDHPELGLNGIDFLEVLDDPQHPDAPERQRLLFIHFIHAPEGLSLSQDNVRIEGGDRLRDVRVTQAQVVVDSRSGSDVEVLVVEVNHPGDFSTYTLRLVPTEGESLESFDPILRVVDFSFKVNCGSNFDCQQKRSYFSKPRTEPALDYLARDYASFRQLMLDRLSVLMPDWKERNPADLGIALIELLAYVGDYLSYQQDAIATEAYLGTARRRVSVRRHARLVDYFMHDGCNARAWVQVQVKGTPGLEIRLPKGTPILTAMTGELPRLADMPPALGPETVGFETMHEAALFPEHNQMDFYTWGDRECCLPKGATRATLRGNFPHLEPGMILIFQEIRNPRTGNDKDADLNHRKAVRLMEVTAARDPIGKLLEQTAEGNSEAETNGDLTIELTEIRWADEDALPFPLCISAETDEQYGRAYVGQVTVALGNIVLADHGLTIKKEDLGTVPKSRLVRVLPQDKTGGDDRCRPQREESVPPRFRPVLQKVPLTQATPYNEVLFGLRGDESIQIALDDSAVPERLAREFERQGGSLTEVKVTVLEEGSRWALAIPTQTYLVSLEGDQLQVYEPPSASATMTFSAHDAVPAITLESQQDGTIESWKPQQDLLNSGRRREFVVEVESDGRSFLRFGDGQYGARPAVGNSFQAIYRVGNGTQGNVGAGSLVHIVSNDPAISHVTNPLPARGGLEPESNEEVRQKAPTAFLTQARAVTPVDYATVSNRHPEVQKAGASLRWTGSWHTVFVSIDRWGGAPVDSAFEARLRNYLEPYRMAGHDLEIDRPQFVPLEIAMKVQVKPDYFRSDVRSELLDLFSNRILPDGRLGVFHPDNFTFGQTIYLSPLYAAAQQVEGVASVEILKFQRQDAPSSETLEQGKLVLGRQEIARLDNDPNFPERGNFDLKLEGGK